MTPEQLKLGMFLLAVAALTLTAAVIDYRQRRIPNWLTVTALALGLVFRACFEGWAGIGEGLLAFALGFGVLFLVWITGGGGAGDVKLMGALGVWLGCAMTWHVIIGSVVFVVLLSAFAGNSETNSFATRGAHTATKEELDSQCSPIEDTMRDTTATDGPTTSTPRATQRTRVAFAIPAGLATWLAVGLHLAGIHIPRL